MSNNNFLKGSEWRRWDLHLHTPNTKLANGYKGLDDEEIWDSYIDTLEQSQVQAFGITDYFNCDNYFTFIEKYRKKYPETQKVFFPNLEFRFAEAISKEDDNPNVHVIFDNDESVCSKAKIQKFLQNLKIIGLDSAGAPISCSDLADKSDFESASITMKGLNVALADTFGEVKPYLIAFPANNDGTRSTDPESPRKVRASDTMDELAGLFFGNSKNKVWFLKEDRYKTGKSEAKPVVSGSDAHSFEDLIRLEGNVVNFEPTWIKANLTFRGLQQICYEPESRVFIGDEPPVEIRKAQQATKFLSNLSIDQIPGYDESNGSWFKDVNIPLNPELVAIIGNKGSGKSALVDILGLLGESRQEPYFSFLSNQPKNRKFKKSGYAEKFNGVMALESTSLFEKNLNENIDKTKPELVRYLPQNYFEKLTNDIEIKAFRKEIEDVVFSHVEETDKMGKSSFGDLQEFKTQQVIHETSVLKSRLSDLNIEIIRLEDESDPLHKISLQEELNAKKEELNALERQKPKKVDKPTGQTDDQKKLSEQIALLNSRIDDINAVGKKTKELVGSSKNKLQKLTSLSQKLSTLDAEISRQEGELKSICDELGLDINKILSAEINVSPILKMTEVVKSEILKYEKDNELVFDDSTDFPNPTSLPDLRVAFDHIKGRISFFKEQLGTPQRKYQSYIDKLSKWQSLKVDIQGEKDDPVKGTINYLENMLAYINGELTTNLLTAVEERKKISQKIFGSKEQILKFYSELKKSVDTKLNSVRTKEFSVNIDAAFVLDQSFEERFLNFVNKKKTGAFYGIYSAQEVLKDLLKEVDWNDFGSVYKLIEQILAKLKNHNGNSNSIREQISDIEGFYDFIFSFNFFSTKYELRLGGKSLNELSPGEKGLLLLVFYLQLDKHNTPLIIDQPEDNLDNESIFTVLATCIRNAKKNRQVILVTHNPNLAVGADAEQIIYVKLEKAKNYKFSYESGAIEDSRITQKIIDVLEGTQPAFVKRRLKYQI